MSVELKGLLHSRYCRKSPTGTKLDLSLNTSDSFFKLPIHIFSYVSDLLMLEQIRGHIAINERKCKTTIDCYRLLIDYVSISVYSKLKFVMLAFEGLNKPNVLLECQQPMMLLSGIFASLAMLNNPPRKSISHIYLMAMRCSLVRSLILIGSQGSGDVNILV